MKKAAAIVVLPDCYNKPQTHYDLMRYVKTVSSAANTLPLLYHHFPKVTGVDCKYTLVCTLIFLLTPIFYSGYEQIFV